MKAYPATSHPRVAIFRSILLPLSETFVRAQAEALQGFDPVYVGLRRGSALPPAARPCVYLGGPAGKRSVPRELAYYGTGRAPRFFAAIRSFDPVLIHAHFAPDGVVALPIKRALGLPLAVSLHGYDVTMTDTTLGGSPSGRMFLLRRQQLRREAAVFLCVSRFVRECALASGYPEDKLRVHYTGTDCDRFGPSSEPRDTRLILFVGRLVTKKGCSFLLDAVARLKAQGHSMRIVVIGDGPLRSGLEQQARSLDLDCEFLGAQPPEVVRSWMGRARLFCAPSVRSVDGDSEGFGMVFTEAQAMGTPVASFRHGGIPEAVEDGVTGLLAPEGDVEALAHAIQQLLYDQSLWERFSANATTWVRQHFSLQQQTRALEDIYASLVGTGPAVRQSRPALERA